MSTRIDTTTPPRVGTVTVRALPAHADATVHAVVIGDTIVGTHNDAGTAERVAAELRGMLANAYLAGQATERDHVRAISAELIQRGRDWLAHRAELSEQEAAGNYPAPGRWHDSDDDGTNLAESMLATLVALTDH